MVSQGQTREEFQEVRNHVLKFTKPKDLLAWRALGTTVLYLLISAYLIWSGYIILGWGLLTLTNIRIFVQFHDMAHYSFFTSPALNKFFGTIFGIYVHFPFDAWRDGHNHHHKHFGNLNRFDLSQTILFTKQKYEKMSTPKKIMVRFVRQPIIFFFFTSPYAWFLGLFYLIVKRYGLFSKVFLQKVASIIIFLYVFPLLGISSLGMCIAIYLTNLFGTMLFHLQHSVNLPYRQRGENWNFIRAALQGSTFLDIPYLLKPFTNGIEYHHIHHLNTNVASYMISDCHNSFMSSDQKKVGWEKYHINKVDYWTSAKSLLNVMFDEESKVLKMFSYKHL